MPKIKSLTPKQLIKIIKQKGFQLDHATGSHFIFYHPVSRQRVTVPVHTKDLPKGTILAIIKQADISKDEL